MDFDVGKLLALEEDLRRDLEAVARVRKLMTDKNGSLARPDRRQLSFGTIGETEQVGSATTLIGVVNNLINSDPAAKWTTQKVVSRLTEDNYKFRSVKPVYSVGQALNTLVSRGDIRITRRGAGSEPNIYRAKLPAEHPSAQEEDSQDMNIAE